MGIRGYIPEVLDVLKCHQDLQLRMYGHENLLLKYAATYLPKFSDGPGKELMDNASSAYSAARRVLFTFHPGEPEMWLQMSQYMLPYFCMGGTMLRKPEYVKRYETCEWKGSMSLVDYLRRTNDKGEVLQHIRRAYAGSDATCSVEDFAVRFPVFGEKVVAAEYLSVFNDHFFGQWLAMNQPFEIMEDLLLPEVVAKVPDGLKFLACAQRIAPDVWKNEACIREYLHQRAFKHAFVETAVSMINASSFLIERYLCGTMEKPVVADEALPVAVRSFEDDSKFDDLVLAPEQKKAETAINMRVDQALHIRSLDESAELEDQIARVQEHGSMVAIMGPPGSGKTAVLDRCIRRAVRLGARVLMALPTGALRARMKQRHPDIELDTCHGAFLLHRPQSEGMGIMLGYDLVVIDEAFQLFASHFDRLHEQWCVASMCSQATIGSFHHHLAWNSPFMIMLSGASLFAFT